MTTDELAALQDSGLSRDTPYVIEGVSGSQFSIARLYGGATFNGESYVYDPTEDELIRRDVVKWLGRRRSEELKASKLKAQAETKSRQRKLLDM